ncbi:uncharacterized protein LOC111033742 [Myzus persicae]|uniref:uncharacterized protein LOC111033742 n=1 Tax=Myzus persicae TaxID=13164 RepID=UPI000B9322E6|nr:uncharacterized protein LOC111033742 [Myzus persicae]
MLNLLKPGLHLRPVSSDFELSVVNTKLNKTYEMDFASTLQGRYTNTNYADLSIFIKMVVALPFIPIEDLDAATQQLGDDLPEFLQPLLDWFEDNLHLRVLSGQDRTNNHIPKQLIEMGVQHPSLWSFINCLR